MRLKISHTTRYSFDAPVRFGLQQLRMTPLSGPTQTVLDWDIALDGARVQLDYLDHHGNRVQLVSIEPGATGLSLTCSGEVEVEDTHGVVGPHRDATPLWLFSCPTPRTTAGVGSKAIAAKVAGATPLDRLHALSGLIHDAVSYEVGASHPDWSAEDAVKAGAGVCQDHAHVFIACARLLGFPARYVSGYLLMEDRTEQDATHAWAEAYVDDLGWVGFDVSNGISPDGRYVRVATGLDYSEAAPVIGTRVGGEGESLDVAIEVAQQ
ncbi:MAG: transglutaminase family protein [Rhodobacteraceae bacterium]|nr:transglutaminase family protein [Paracoccaceae bacterium]